MSDNRGNGNRWLVAIGALLVLAAGTAVPSRIRPGGPSAALQRRLQQARLAAELSYGRSTVFAREPPDPTSLGSFDGATSLTATVSGAPEQRWRAISILGEPRDPRAVPPLIDAVERRDTSVAASYALARIGSAEGARAVASAARDDALAPWRMEPLGEFGRPEAEPALRALAASEAADRNTRASAARGLWKVSVLRARAELDGPHPERARPSLRWLSLRGVRSPLHPHAARASQRTPRRAKGEPPRPDRRCPLVVRSATAGEDRSNPSAGPNVCPRPGRADDFSYPFARSIPCVDGAEPEE